MRNKSCGFTLIELLIVIIIISIVATIGVLSIKVNDNKKIETLADQIVNVITLAEQEALLRSVTYGIKVEPHELQFFEYRAPQTPEENPWIIPSDSLLKISIPKDITLTLKIDGETVQSHKPKIIISPGGDLSAFTLYLSKNNSAPHYKIIGEDNGNLKSGVVHAEE